MVHQVTPQPQNMAHATRRRGLDASEVAFARAKRRQLNASWSDIAKMLGRYVGDVIAACDWPIEGTLPPPLSSCPPPKTAAETPDLGLPKGRTNTLTHRVLKTLGKGCCTPAELSQTLSANRSSIQHSLKRSALVGFVEQRAEGPLRLYSLTPAGKLELRRLAARPSQARSAA